jgi:diaminopimelate decarboxylase
MKSNFLNSTFGANPEDDQTLLQAANKYKTPLYLYSEADLLAAVERFKSPPAQIPIEVHYAVKANSNPYLLTLLARQGLGVDLVSQGELEIALKAGFSPLKMVFSGVGKTESEIIRAVKLQIRAFNVESESELSLIESVARKMRRRVSVSLRFNPDVDAKTHPYISTGLHENKFGMDRNSILKLLADRQRFKHLNFAGVSVHIGSQIQKLAPFREAFILVKKLIDQIYRNTGHSFEFVDLGGGTGVPYQTHEAPFDLKEYLDLIRTIFTPSLNNKSHPPLKSIFVEPGRSIVAQSGVLISRVVHLKKNRRKSFVILDAGMNYLVRPALYQSHHEIRVIDSHFESRSGPPSGPDRQSPHPKNSKFDVVGPVCETADTFAKDRLLSSEIKPGDYVAILTAGAYGMSMASQYNARPRPAEVLVTQNQKLKLIRKREKIADLVR